MALQCEILPRVVGQSRGGAVSVTQPLSGDPALPCFRPTVEVVEKDESEQDTEGMTEEDYFDGTMNRRRSSPVGKP